MSSQNSKVARRFRRKRGIRKRVRGTSGRPRLTVFRSLKHIYAQIINDDLGVTICQASTRDKDLRDEIKTGGNVAAARIVGAVLGKRAKAKSIEEVCFDRNGYRYGGRIRGLADAAREAGLKF